MRGVQQRDALGCRQSDPLLGDRDGISFVLVALILRDHERDRHAIRRGHVAQATGEQIEEEVGCEFRIRTFADNMRDGNTAVTVVCLFGHRPDKGRAVFTANKDLGLGKAQVVRTRFQLDRQTVRENTNLYGDSATLGATGTGGVHAHDPIVREDLDAAHLGTTDKGKRHRADIIFSAEIGVDLKACIIDAVPFERRFAIFRHDGIYGDLAPDSCVRKLHVLTVTDIHNLSPFLYDMTLLMLL